MDARIESQVIVRGVGSQSMRAAGAQCLSRCEQEGVLPRDTTLVMKANLRYPIRASIQMRRRSVVKDG